MKCKCPHMHNCEMYEIFTLAGTLETWKINYCTGDYERCKRYELASQGKPVAVNLMPNGALLRRTLPSTDTSSR